MLRLKSSEFQLLPDQKILRAAEYQAYLDAEGIIAAAKAEADRIIAAAQEEYLAQQKAGYDAGVLDAKLEMAEKLVEGVDRAVEYFTVVEDQVVGVVMKSLDKILGEFTDQDLVARVVKHTLGLARGQRMVTLRVRPEDVQPVKARMNELLASHPMIAHVQVEGDVRLERGGCIMETDMGVVDASIDVQLEAIRKSLTRSVKGQ